MQKKQNKKQLCRAAISLRVGVNVHKVSVSQVRVTHRVSPGATCMQSCLLSSGAKLLCKIVGEVKAKVINPPPEKKTTWTCDVVA